MAFDKSEPRSGLIFQIGLFAVVCLVGIRGVLIPYFDSITSGEQHRKIGMVVPAALLNLRADEDQRLKSGPMPVDKAMEAIVARGRMGASPDIMPSASKDIGPMQGWMKMPNEVPSPMMAAALDDGGAPAAPAASTSVDAGAPAALHGTLPGVSPGVSPGVRPVNGPITPSPPKKPATK
jgi:hypothetical protein